MTMTPRLRKFWTLLILLGGMVGSMFIAGQWAWQRSLQEENRSVAIPASFAGACDGKPVATGL